MPIEEIDQMLFLYKENIFSILNNKGIINK